MVKTPSELSRGATKAHSTIATVRLRAPWEWHRRTIKCLASWWTNQWTTSMRWWRLEGSCLTTNRFCLISCPIKSKLLCSLWFTPTRSKTLWMHTLINFRCSQGTWQQEMKTIEVCQISSRMKPFRSSRLQLLEELVPRMWYYNSSNTKHPIWAFTIWNDNFSG